MNKMQYYLFCAIDDAVAGGVGTCTLAFCMCVFDYVWILNFSSLYVSEIIYVVRTCINILSISSWSCSFCI